MSMPGIGIGTGARILIDVGDGTAFPSAAHLAASNWNRAVQNLLRHPITERGLGRHGFHRNPRLTTIRRSITRARSHVLDHATVR